MVESHILESSYCSVFLPLLSPPPFPMKPPLPYLPPSTCPSASLESTPPTCHKHQDSAFSFTVKITLVLSAKFHSSSLNTEILALLHHPYPKIRGEVFGEDITHKFNLVSHIFLRFQIVYIQLHKPER